MLLKSADLRERKPLTLRLATDGKMKMPEEPIIKDNIQKAEKGKFDYKIKTINDSEYELSMVLYSQNRLIKMIFEQSRKKLHKKGVNVRGGVDIVKAFNIPEGRFIKMLKFHIKPNWAVVADIARKDGYFLQDYDVESARFVKDEEYPLWQIHINIRGGYIDAR